LDDDLRKNLIGALDQFKQQFAAAHADAKASKDQAKNQAAA
jgi:hypothetical protein